MSKIVDVGLFETTDKGTRMLGSSQDPELVENVREWISSELREKIQRIDPPSLRLVRKEMEADEMLDEEPTHEKLIAAIGKRNQIIDNVQKILEYAVEFDDDEGYEIGALTRIKLQAALSGVRDTQG